MSCKKKILLVTSSSKIGGVENLIYNIAKYLNKYFVIDILVGQLKGELHDKYNSVCNKLYGPYNINYLYTDIYKFVDFKEYDIVHVFNYFKFTPIISSHMKNSAKLIQSIHFGYDSIQPYMKDIKSMYGKKRIIYISDNHEHGYWNHNLNLIDNIIDIDNYFISNNNDRKYDFIWVGKNSHAKNIELLNDIVKLNKYNIAIVDGNPFNNPVVNHIVESEKVDFFEQVDSNGLRELYNDSNCILSTSNSEGLPVSMIEACRCGCIPVSTNVGNIYNFISNLQYGYIYNNIKDIINIDFNIESRINLSNKILEINNKSLKKYKDIYNENLSN